MLEISVAVPIPYTTPVEAIRALQAGFGVGLQEAMAMYAQLSDVAFGENPFVRFSVAEDSFQHALSELKRVGLRVEVHGCEGA